MHSRHRHLLPFTLLAVLGVLACGDGIAGPHPSELDDLKDNLSELGAGSWEL